MPEFWIVAVHYDAGVIARVRYINSDSTQQMQSVHVSTLKEESRETVRDWILAHGSHVRTGLVASGSVGWTNYRRGAEVVPTDDGFLTTEADGVTYNNLSHLPRF